MKNTKGMLFILLASILTGFFITISINLDNKSTNISLNAIEYKNAIEQRNKLYGEIESIKKQNIEYKDKIKKYDVDTPNKTKELVDDMKSQLIEYSRLSGFADTKGQGLVIKVQDGDIDKVLDTQFEILRKIFHEDDMALILNEVRKAGAEAIAVNNHRILQNTGASCNWAYIGFDDETRESAPFYIYAIGNPKEMKASLLADNSHIQSLILRKIKVEIEEKNDIIIPATKQNTELKFMQRADLK